MIPNSSTHPARPALKGELEFDRVHSRTHHPVLLLLAATLCTAAQGAAQWYNFGNPPEHRLTVDFGGGLTPTLGSTTQRLTTGWNLQVGGGVNLNDKVGILAQFMYSGLGVNQSVIQESGAPGATSNVWGISLDPIVRVKPKGRVGFYFIGGPGFYRRTINFTQPVLAQTLIFDPFFGIYPITYQTNQTIASFSKNAFGLNGGMGVTFAVGQGGAKLFAEARYHWIRTSNRYTRILPITFGVRW